MPKNYFCTCQRVVSRPLPPIARMAPVFHLSKAEIRSSQTIIFKQLSKQAFFIFPSATECSIATCNANVLWQVSPDKFLPETHEVLCLCPIIVCCVKGWSVDGSDHLFITSPLYFSPLFMQISPYHTQTANRACSNLESTNQLTTHYSVK